MAFIYPVMLSALLPLLLFYIKNKNRAHNTRQLTLLYLTMAFIIIALSRPVLNNSLEDKKFDAQEYIIALDASFSMQAQDLQPTRYEVAKDAIKKLLSLHPNDRFSLFVFTSNTLLISPPTTDTAISISALDALNPKYILTKSTSLKTLLNTIAKSSFDKKKLIIFTDGGEEHNLNSLVKITQNATIQAYIVATASQDGAPLKKDGHLIKDQYSSIVISRVNPILQELATLSGGKYYALESNNLNIINKLSEDIHTKKDRVENVKVKSYKELYSYALIIAMILFMLSVTKLHQLYIFLVFLFVPHSSDAGVLDFYHLDKAQSYYEKKEYLQAAQEFEKLSPSVASYFNTASAYYKAAHYKTALEYFSLIKSPNKEIKQACFYAMGNSAVQLKRYYRAKTYYLQALALGEDNDTLYNLNLLHKLQVKTGVNLIDMLPEKNAQTKKNSSKSTSKQKDEKKQGGAKKSSNRSAQARAGAGANAKKQEEKKSSNKKKKSSNNTAQNNNYKMSYKAYEIINKGYTNEQAPW